MLQALLIVAFILLTGLFVVAGVVVLIVGLVKKRERMWKRGLALAAIALAVLLGLAGVGAIKAAEKAYGFFSGPLIAPPSEAETRDMFKSATGLTVPADAKCLNVRSDTTWSFGAGGMSYFSMKLAAPPQLKAALKAKFKPADGTPDELMAISAERQKLLPWWNVAEMKGMTCYEGESEPGSDGYYWTVTFAFDDERPIIYLKASEVDPPNTFDGSEGATPPSREIIITVPAKAGGR